MNEITTVVFDLGNVLIGWDPKVVWRATMSEDKIERFLRESDFSRLNHQMDAGLPFEEALAQMEQAAPQHVDTFSAYWSRFPESLTGPIEGSWEVVQDLKGAGIRLLGLTNWSAQSYHHAPIAAPAIALLEDVLVSGRENLAKPDPAIFQLLIDRFDLVPHETVFVDDSPPNVEAARGLGIHSHRFVGAAQFREWLIETGVPIGPAVTDPGGGS